MSEFSVGEPPVDRVEPAHGPEQQLAHPDAIAQLERLAPEFYSVGDGAWCLVGNGLSNQSFVRGPEGIIAIDTGECVEEMRQALKELRAVTDLPVVACIYTHFHYVNGTQAILEELSVEHRSSADLTIVGHAEIDANRARFGGEIAPRSNKGLVYQFGTQLPEQGPDALLHCGLGLNLRNPDHAPYSTGYVPANRLINHTETLELAGLTVEISPAPADANDSVTIWFPELKLCVNNLVWPALFNIYAIRGEEYRDPRVLLSGIDHIIDLAPDHLLVTHGPPMADLESLEPIISYRDSIQFLWDQTVRRTNAGDTLDDAIHNIELPAHLRSSYLTQQFYGVAEHHIKQIHAGLFGWFDGDESQLFNLPTATRNDRLIEGFGGRAAVSSQAAQALTDGDYRWALELATWLVRCHAPEAEDAALLARVLRHIAQHTVSANIRNWTLTRALEVEGAIDLSRHHGHRFSEKQVLAADPTRYIPILRVLLNPQRAQDLHLELGWRFSTGERCGLLVRNQVAIPTRGDQSQLVLGLSHETWAQVLSEKLNLWQGIDDGIISLAGDPDKLADICQAFELPSLQLPA